MRRLWCGALGALLGVPAGALLVYGLVAAFSGNTHDRALEATMTAAFAGAPLGALLGAIAGALVGGRHAGRAPPDAS